MWEGSAVVGDVLAVLSALEELDPIIKGSLPPLLDVLLVLLTLVLVPLSELDCEELAAVVEVLVTTG